MNNLTKIIFCICTFIMMPTFLQCQIHDKDIEGCCTIFAGTWDVVFNSRTKVEIELVCIRDTIQGTFTYTESNSTKHLSGTCTSRGELLLTLVEPQMILTEKSDNTREHHSTTVEITGFITPDGNSIECMEVLRDNESGMSISKKGFVAVKKIE